MGSKLHKVLIYTVNTRFFPTEKFKHIFDKRMDNNFKQLLANENFFVVDRIT